MADRDRATVDVQLVVIDAECVAAIDDLYREGFIELPQADVVDGQIVLLEQFRHGEYRADAHFVGFQARHGDTAIDPEGLQALPLGKPGIHEYLRRRAVRKLRRVTGRDRAALDDSLEAREPFGRRGPHTFVC